MGVIAGKKLGRVARLAGMAIAAATMLSASAGAQPDGNFLQAGYLTGKCRLIDFDSVYFKDGGGRGVYLYIGGSRQFTNMDVALEQRPGSRRGDWIIEVVGCTSNFLVMPIRSPYNIEVPMRDLPGARTLRIVGASGSITRKVPGR